MRKIDLDGCMSYSGYEYVSARQVRIINLTLGIVMLLMFAWFPFRLICREWFGYCGMV